MNTRGRDSERAQRQAAISERVINEGTVRIEDLTAAFQVSPMTIHRDLDALEAQGLLRKSRGSVTALATSRSEASTSFRVQFNVAGKRAVAEAALAYVEPGSALILDDSTTGLWLCPLLPQKQPLTVITNFQPVMTALAEQAHINLIALGGQYYPWCSAYMGSVTLSALSQLRADTFIMSTSAIVEDVCYHQHHDTVLVKRAAFEASHTRILYVDHSKFAARALHALLPLSEFDIVIVDDATERQHVDRLRRQGVNVVVAPTATAPHPG